MFGSVDRFALGLALLVFILADLRGATFAHALQRAVATYFFAWAVQSLWRWVVWPWLRASSEKRESRGTGEPEPGLGADEEREELSRAA